MSTQTDDSVLEASSFYCWNPVDVFTVPCSIVPSITNMGASPSNNSSLPKQKGYYMPKTISLKVNEVRFHWYTFFNRSIGWCQG